MKRIILTLITAAVMLSAVIGLTSCQEADEYERFDEMGYTVSVKYDANGGVFTGTSSVMVDSFNIADMKKDASGMVQLRLIDPTDSARGSWNPTNGKKVLAGWYKERNESTDSKNCNGSNNYTDNKTPVYIFLFFHGFILL